MNVGQAPALFTNNLLAEKQETNLKLCQPRHGQIQSSIFSLQCDNILYRL